MSTRESSLPDPRHASAEELLAHAAWLRRLARSLVTDAATAEDLVQDTWIAALRKPPRSDQPIGPWLARVVQNLAHSRRRSESRRTAREAARFVERHEPGSDEAAGSLEMQRVLIDAVESLDEPLRSTLVRHYFHAKTSVEIAREDGVADSTVRWRLKQAVDDLKKRLDARHDGDRRAWSALLVPLARRADIAAPATSVAATAAGVFLMSTWIKIAIVSLVAVLSLAGWLSFRSVEPTKSEPTVALSPARPAELDTPAIAKPDAANPAREVVAADPKSAPSAASAKNDKPAPVDYTAHVEARVVDVNGAPIANALMTCILDMRPDASSRDKAPKAATGEDGRVRMVVKKSYSQRGRGRSVVAAPDTWLLVLEFTAPGKAAQTKEINLKADTDSSLGDVALLDGGDLAGRAVDEGGKPVAGADVNLVMPDLTASERAQMTAKGRLDKRSVGRAKTREDGSFELKSVPIGHYRVWTKLKGRETVVSEPFEVRTAESTKVPDLVMTENLHDIRGVVLGLDGSPQKLAEVEYKVAESGREYWDQEFTDENGRFVIEEFHTPSTDLWVRGPWPKPSGIASAVPADRGQILVRDVKAGTRDLVLRLITTPLTRVVVKDAHGDVVDPVTLGVMDLAGGGEQLTSHGADHQIRLLAKPCNVVVSGAGIVKKEVGPFESAHAPAELEIVVERTAVISGRVISNGKPVGDAWISASEILPPDSGVTQTGFPLRVDPMSHEGCTTSADGAFAFSVEKEGQWVLVVRSRGFANYESEPTELGPAHGKSGLELALGHGGSVEGRVSPAPSSDTDPAYVTLSRGNGADASARVQKDGTYRISDLTPGTWKLGLTHDDWNDGGIVRHGVPADSALRDVEIVEAQTAHADIDARAFVFPKLVGHFTMQGVDASKWTAGLVCMGTVNERGPSGAVDASGRFVLVADETGPHRLKVACSTSAQRVDTITQELDLTHGTIDWTYDVATGAVRLPASASGSIAITQTSSAGATWSVQVQKDAGRELLVEHVPVGTVSVQAAGRARVEAAVRAADVTTVGAL